MNKTIFTLVLTCAMASCQDTPSNMEQSNSNEPIVNESEVGNESSDKVGEIADKPSQTESESSRIISGIWTGEMNGKKLKIVVENVDGNTLTGYNILGSNRRPLRGIFQNGSFDQPCSKALEATLSEPGDDKWDGVYTIKFVGYQNMDEDGDQHCDGSYTGFEAFGSWKSNNGKLTHEFTLIKIH